MAPSRCVFAALAVAGVVNSLDGGASEECMSEQFVDRMTSKFSCPRTWDRLAASKTELPENCHVQGVAMREDLGLLVTCVDQTLSGGGYGRVLWYGSPDSEKTALASVAATGTNTAAKHPSATQLLPSGDFPVSFAMGTDTGPATIRFFSVSSGTLAGPLGQTLEHPESHMGALAIAKLDGWHHIVGCGWSCEQFAVWSSSESASSGYQRTFYTGKTGTIVDSSGVDANVGSYNSLYLTRRCSDKTPLLFATHDKWIDVWELSGLGTSSVQMKKIQKRKIGESVVSWGNNDIFKEGFTVLPQNGGTDAVILALPHDYGTGSCPHGLRCTQHVYQCQFADDQSSEQASDSEHSSEAADHSPDPDNQIWL